MLGMKEMNGVVKLNNGYLFAPIRYTSNEELDAYAKHLAEVKNYLKDKNIEFIYAIAPYTVNKFNPQLPVGIKDIGNDVADRLCNFLTQQDIDFIDFRQELYNDGIDQYKMMYKTDHHWTTKMGFYAFCKIANKIEEKLGTKLDAHLTDFNNYNVTTYKKWHLGYWGRRTGIFFGDVDDFDLITPKFETRIEKNDMIGDYETQLISKQALKKKKYNGFVYENVLGGSREHCRNLNATNNIKIAVITESFGYAVAPFLDISYAECKYFNAYEPTNIKDLVEYKPDIVIDLMYVSNCARMCGDFSFN